MNGGDLKYSRAITCFTRRLRRTSWAREFLSRQNARRFSRIKRAGNNECRTRITGGVCDAGGELKRAVNAGLQRSKYTVNTMTRSKCEMLRVATAVCKHTFVDKLLARRVIDLNSGLLHFSLPFLPVSPSAYPPAVALPQIPS